MKWLNNNKNKKLDEFNLLYIINKQMDSNKKIEQNFNEMLFLPHINGKSIPINDSMRR